MATRFMRVDLSPSARDFEDVVVEPGIPFLGSSNTHYRVLQKWFDRFVAEPQRNGDFVDFFVCDDQQGRLQDVRCDPLTADDLKKSRDLQKDYDDLIQRLQAVQPEPRYESLKRATLRHLEKVAGESGPVQKGCYFFRYREGRTWRLVWAWGFQRKDLAPAAPTICTNPNCSLLFVRTGHSSRSCPACEQSGTTVSKPRSRSRWKTVAAMALLLFLAAGLGYYFGRTPSVVSPPEQASLQVTPSQWTGPVGSQLRYDVHLLEPDGSHRDVTSEVLAVAEHPKVLRLDPFGTRAVARGVGRTPVHFYLGDEVAHAVVDVGPPQAPQRLEVQPAEVTLGIGTTAQLTVLGHYDEGPPIDLTEAVQWRLPPGSAVSCRQGFLEGIAQGSSTITAMYRTSPDQPETTGAAEVTVTPEEYVSLELSLQPSLLVEGRAGRIEALVTSADGVQRSVLHSRQLRLRVVPPQLANVTGDYLHALREGSGRIEGSFAGLPQASCKFQIGKDASPVRFEIRPRDLRLAVHETTELQLLSSGRGPVRVESSNPQIVEVLGGMRVAGRAPGKARLTVRQEAREAEVVVEVQSWGIESIAIVPDRIEVPVQDTVDLRLIGRCAEGTEIDLVADEITWEQLPTSAFAEIDPHHLRVLGRAPTGQSPQRVVAAWGEHRANATIEVTSPALTLQLLPAGPIDVPVGQLVPLQVFADLGGGRRVQVPTDQVQWSSEPQQLEGLVWEPSRAGVRAMQPDRGPMMVRAEYRGLTSSPVEFRSVQAPSLELLLEADRRLMLPGTAGMLRARTVDASVGELDGVQFASSDPKILTVDPQTGAYQALGPGTVQVAARLTDRADVAPVRLELRVVDPRSAELRLEPSETDLAIGGRVPLEVLLTVDGQQQPLSWSNDAEDLRLGIGRTDAIQWQSPYLIGLAIADPFEVTATYHGLTAHAVVRVILPPDSPELRVVPSNVTLAPGQVMTPRVQQRLGEASDNWQEIDPQQVRWEVPDTVVWTPPAAGMPPSVTPIDGASGDLEIIAQHGGATASGTITVSDAPLPSGPLVIVRQPPGESLPVGQQQRYLAMFQDGEELVAAADVQWTPAFENDYVRWDPPVLTARQPGHLQRLSAESDDRRKQFATRTVPRPSRPGAPAQPTGRPAQVRIVYDHQPPLTLPVGAAFDAFRVQAVYPDRPSTDVTHQAVLRIDGEESARPPLAISDGRLIAQHPGRAEMRAAVYGVDSENALSVVVNEDVDVTDIEIQPDDLELRVGERTRLRAIGFVGRGDQRQQIGDLAQVPGIQWTAESTDVLYVDGPMVEGRQEGQTRVRARLGSTSASSGVTVVPVIEVLAQHARLSPDELVMHEGETRWLGRDIRLTRSEADLSDQLRVASPASPILSYDAEQRSLQGISEGSTDLILTAGNDRYTLPVRVEPLDLASLAGSVMIEPASDTLAEGESLDLRVWLVTDQGQRLDLTRRAILQSDAPRIVTLQGNHRAVALAPGVANLTARVPGIDSPGQAELTVIEETFTQLTVFPSSLRLATGQETELQVTGWGFGGRRDLSHHPDLTWSIDGDDPQAVAVAAGPRVRGASPGRAAVTVAWRELNAAPVQVQVADDPILGLRIEPDRQTTPVGTSVDYRIYARHRDQVRPLSEEDGLRLQVADTAVAAHTRGLAVRGIATGSTEVIARLGPHQATAHLQVVPPGPTPRAPLRPDRLFFLPDVLSLQVGHPGETVRILQRNEQGETEDVDHLVEIEIEDPAVAGVRPTASGPVFVPNQLGSTTAVARLPERLGGLETRQPMVIRVFKPTAPSRLIVRPDPVTLAVDERADFQRVRIVPGEGGAPIDVDYQVVSQNPSIVAVQDGKTLRAVAAGQAAVRIVPVNVDPMYQDLSEQVNVTVGTGAADEPQLRLTGPSRTTVGAEVAYRVQWFGPDGQRDVTNDGAMLVAPQSGSDRLVDLRSGCRLLANQVGTLEIRARYRDQISNALPLQIDPPAGAFARLDLEIDSNPMVVGERRPYRVWGHPTTGGPRQDLTAMVVATPDAATDNQPLAAVRVVQPKGEEIVLHAPPILQANAPGTFQFGARLNSGLRSDVVELEIRDAEADRPEGIVELRVSPTTITVGVDQRVPPLRALARLGPGQEFREVQADWTSLDESILGPETEGSRHFVGRSAGETQLQASYGGHEASIHVYVQGDPFHHVSVDETVNLLDENRFAVSVNVQAQGIPEGSLEFRVVFGAEQDVSTVPWTPMPAGSGGRVTLTSPSMAVGRPGTVYHVVVEARPRGQAEIARYPLSFSVITDQRVEERPSSP